MIYGYARVSTNEQNLDRQLDAFKATGIAFDEIFEEKKSGKNVEDRKIYKRMIRKLKRDDQLVIKSIDRLGRNYEEILEQWRIITKVKKADIYVIDMPILDTRKDKHLIGTFIADLVLSVLSFVAENERANILQREGIDAAMKRGVRFGRPRGKPPKNLDAVMEMIDKKEISGYKASQILGISTGQAWRYIQEHKGVKKWKQKLA